MVIENMVRLHIIIFIEIIMDLSHNPTEYEPNEGFHHNIIDTCNHYGMQSNGADNFKPDGFYAWDIKGIRYGLYGKQWKMLYSRVIEQELLKQ